MGGAELLDRSFRLCLTDGGLKMTAHRCERAPACRLLGRLLASLLSDYAVDCGTICSSCLCPYVKRGSRTRRPCTVAEIWPRGRESSGCACTLCRSLHKAARGHFPEDGQTQRGEGRLLC